MRDQGCGMRVEGHGGCRCGRGMLGSDCQLGLPPPLAAPRPPAGCRPAPDGRGARGSAGWRGRPGKEPWPAARAPRRRPGASPPHTCVRPGRLGATASGANLRGKTQTQNREGEDLPENWRPKLYGTHLECYGETRGSVTENIY